MKDLCQNGIGKTIFFSRRLMARPDWPRGYPIFYDWSTPLQPITAT